MRNFIKVAEYRESGGTIVVTDLWLNTSKIVFIRIDNKKPNLDNKYDFIKLTLDNGSEIGIMANVNILMEILQGN